MASPPVLEPPPRGRFLVLVVVGLALIGATYLWKLTRTRAPTVSSPRTSSAMVGTNLLQELLALERHETEIAQTVWARELLAEHCAGTIEQLWDALNSSTNDFDLLGGIRFERLS